MSKKKEVVVEGGGHNLYKVSEAGGKHYVNQVKVGLFGYQYTDVGEAGNMDDALSLVRAHSGKQIKKIKDW